MLSTRVCSRTAAHAWQTALFSSATVEGAGERVGVGRGGRGGRRWVGDGGGGEVGLGCGGGWGVWGGGWGWVGAWVVSSMSRIKTDIWSQICSIWFMSGLRAGQSMTSTSCWSKKAVSCAVWGGALSWTYTKLRPNTSVAHGNIWFLRIWMYWCRFMAPSTTTSSLLPPWWIVPHTMIDGPRYPSLGWTQASISLSPCLRRTWTWPPLWYKENRNSSLEIQCVHCLRSHTLCPLPHSR